MTTDIVIGIIPKIEPYAPTTGPALLKSHCEAEGFNATVIDYNIRLYRYLQSKFKAIKYYESNDAPFISWYDTEYAYDKNWDELWYDIEPEVMRWIKELGEIKPRFVGLSLLTKVSVAVGQKFATLIKEHYPDIKIVAGGGGVRPSMQQWIDRGILDYYVYGDGEFNLPALLRGDDDRPGINTRQPSQIEDLNATLMPNYEDIDWTKYEEPPESSKIVYVTASRGCVKRCTFCDVPLLWPKYTWRSADHVWREMMYLFRVHGRRTFRFTDSLINGSMKMFRELLNYIIIHNRVHSNNPDNQIRWWSQWIIRSKTQMNESDFQLLSRSGIIELDIGIESFSESVRYHMGKKFSDEDMWWNFEMMHKYNIHFTALMITGYPTETLEDHQITLDAVRKFGELGYVEKHSNRPNTAYLSFGNTMQMAPDTKIYKMMIMDPDFTNYEDDIIWTYKDNTPEERLRRHKEVNDLVHEVTGQQESWMEAKTVREHEDKVAMVKVTDH